MTNLLALHEGGPESLIAGSAGLTFGPITMGGWCMCAAWIVFAVVTQLKFVDPLPTLRRQEAAAAAAAESKYAGYVNLGVGFRVQGVVGGVKFAVPVQTRGCRYGESMVVLYPPCLQCSGSIKALAQHAV